MPDITMCNGGKCPLKEKCYRYLATPSKYRQSYFVTPPFETNNEETVCSYFSEIKNKQKMKEEILNLLRREAEAKKARALMTLKGYANNFAAVGEHSTEDLYEDIRKAYKDYLDAMDEEENLIHLRRNLSL